jgi:hypothetical protein
MHRRTRRNAGASRQIAHVDDLPAWLMIDWNISRLSSAPTIAAIVSISFRCCLSMSFGNNGIASGASSKNRL